MRRSVFTRVLSAAFAVSFVVAAADAGAQTPAGAPKVENTMAQRVQACTGCHGAQGRAARDGYYPRIAGKPAGYLYHQLLNFREGRRHYALMSGLIAPLSDDYLQEIAQHFADLDLPYAPSTMGTLSPSVLARGQQLTEKGDPSIDVPACQSCHGSALMGVAPAIPALLGLPLDYLNAQLGAWRSGDRHAQSPDCMNAIARRLKPGDISAVSQWLAAQTVPAMTKAAAAPPGKLPLDCGGVAPVTTAVTATATVTATAAAAMVGTSGTPGMSSGRSSGMSLNAAGTSNGMQP